MDRDGYSIKQICIDEWIEEQAAEWKLIQQPAVIKILHDGNISFVQPVIPSGKMLNPDKIIKGTVDGVPAWLGLKEWVSGPDLCYKDYEIVQWKERRGENGGER